MPSDNAEPIVESGGTSARPAGQDPILTRFSLELGMEMMKCIPFEKPVVVRSGPSPADQAFAHDVLDYLKNHGHSVTAEPTIMSASPSPRPFSIDSQGDVTVIVVCAMVHPQASV